jgi:hypothetical protein
LERRSLEGQKGRRTNSLLVTLLGITVLFLFIYTIAQSYEGRVSLRDNLVDRCNQTVIRNEGEITYKTVVGKYSTSPEVRAAAQAQTELIRATTPKSCRDAYPNPSLLPWQGEAKTSSNAVITPPTPRSTK